MAFYFVFNKRIAIYCFSIHDRRPTVRSVRYKYFKIPTPGSLAVWGIVVTTSPPLSF